MSTKAEISSHLFVRYTITNTVLNNGTRTKTQTNSNVVRSVNRTRTGDRNPNYKSQIERGQNASTDFFAEELKYSFTPGYYYLSRVGTNTSTPSSIHTVTSSVRSAPAVGPPDSTFLGVTTASNLASIDFFKKARKAQRAFQALPFFGELTEVISMIRNPAKILRGGISDYIKTVKKRSRRLDRLPDTQFKKGIGVLCADLWLENAFGWQPLLKDIDDGAKALAKLATHTVHLHKMVRGDGSELIEQVDPTVVNTIGTSTSITAYLNNIESKLSEVRYYGKVRLADSDTSLMQPRLLGVTLSDVIPAAWELIPWSFLIDYFTNIGDVIESWAFHKADLAWATKVIRQTNKTSLSWTHIPELNTATFKVLGQSAKDGASVSTRKQVSRVANATIPVPSFRFELPFGSNKWINIGALIAARKSPPRRR
jgi:hypothetical protein